MRRSGDDERRTQDSGDPAQQERQSRRRDVDDPPHQQRTDRGALEQGLTLQQVSDRANIDISMLSRLESGKRRLALDHIPGLAAALGVSTDDLLGEAPASDPRVRGEPITRDGLTMWPLTNRAAGGLRTFKIRITSRRRRPPPRSELRVHEGHDWMYVLDGRMRLILGEQDLIVEPGKAVEFSTNTPRSVMSPPDGPSLRVLGIDRTATRRPCRQPQHDRAGRTTNRL